MKNAVGAGNASWVVGNSETKPLLSIRAWLLIRD
jgi:hypothetical protein